MAKDKSYAIEKVHETLESEIGNVFHISMGILELVVRFHNTIETKNHVFPVINKSPTLLVLSLTPLILFHPPYLSK